MKMNGETTISIILPSKNEERGLAEILPQIKATISHAEIIVIDDGSTDGTASICKAEGVLVVRNPCSLGNGAAIKRGARAASGDVLVFMDADGQHSPHDIPLLLEKVRQGADMAIGARSTKDQASIWRLAANLFYNMMASWMTGRKIMDLTSGFRAVKADKFTEFLHLLPNGFSYPTTITMAFFRAGYIVEYVPTIMPKRKGKSHIHPITDGIRFLMIIFKIGTLYSPLKLFLPISLIHFLIGFFYYLYTYINFGRFTNMSALLFIASMLIFLIGLVSEQITALQYGQRPTNK